MTDIMKTPSPRFGNGPVQGPDMERAMTVVYRDVFSRMDVRYPNNDFSSGLVANNTGGVTLGTGALPAGRTVGIPAITAKIADNGTAQDQRFLPQVSAGNKLSVQSTSPLTSVSGSLTATVSIAAHTVQYGFGQVSYGSGTVAGLIPNTLYYVYASDPDYQGGSVTYLATTNAQTVTAANGNYYVGAITTPLASTSTNISAATSASPIVFTTATAHGWTSGNTVLFAALPGDFGTNLNSTTQTITVVDTTHFSISVNGAAYVAYTSGGTATRQTGGSTGGGGAGGGGGGHPLP